MSGTAVFVYYRVAEHDLPALRVAARAMQAALSGDEPGLHCALLRRPGLREGQVTLMETYAAPGGVGAALQARIDTAALALAPWIAGARHVELFEPLD